MQQLLCMIQVSGVYPADLINRNSDHKNNYKHVRRERVQVACSNKEAEGHKLMSQKVQEKEKTKRLC
jgi:hypothetical protein